LSFTVAPSMLSTGATSTPFSCSSTMSSRSTRSTSLEGGSYHGHDGIRSFWEAYLRVFPDFTAEVDELRDLGEVTVARVRLRFHGTGSDVSFERPISQVARWRERRCVCWHSYRSEADALNDAMPPE
jgi:SnoaL-like domain